ncbi:MULTISPECIES: GNAT family N-acetyltransferase [unclassified Bradyrhizobium]|uniref:GNAT family N-acetyltransferase n=1 Tax=unclassified Bradyrhizobium TaxID=2631580 RepID=UPI001BA8A701|nr:MULTISPECIES: N-acetyltransferase [unclassified Bradyrhizobium]MBR1207619.1 N-acetyltransferase [Bradyrhizobium sp. AUGA SZCCT0124]MBR1316035.1 N-acetyltransferase [Bradyrhizobium sp. AUGA SZCCT0051]MBR1344141.1 N-acetyltransferase [Bradyrhizobium sp. AUGA SZCCT0105]MBR1357872.1 N-acetyltransferase [Bradyrhizobium sp. AUGA SZCCT0045]
MPSFGSPNDKPVAIRQERRSDVAAREGLLDAAFGPGRLAKTSERLREGRKPARGLAFVARRGSHLVGTLRLWPIVTGTGHACLLLGPLAVAEEARCLGIGAALMRQALQRAQRLGHRAVILVGDAAYYDRFGFSAAQTGAFRMPGPYQRDRLLACELVLGALRGAGGLIAAASRPPSRLSGLVDRIAGSQAPLGQPA